MTYGKTLVAATTAVPAVATHSDFRNQSNVNKTKRRRSLNCGSFLLRTWLVPALCACLADIASGHNLVDLGSLASGTSRAYDINNHGVIVGESRFDNGSRIEDFQAIKWVDGELQNLGGLHGPHFGSATIRFINDNNVALGNGWSPTRNPRLLLFNPDGSFSQSLNVDIANKTGVNLSTWVPRGLNNNGDMLLGGGDIWINNPSSNGQPSFDDPEAPGGIYSSNQGDGYLITDLPNFSAYAINDHRIMVGNSYVYDPLTDEGGDQAAVWYETPEDRSVEYLGNFGADRSTARAISNTNIIAGELSYFPDEPDFPDGPSVFANLAIAPDFQSSSAVNTLQQPGFVYNLNTGVAQFFGQPGSILNVTDINDAGDVVGYDTTNQDRAFVVRQGTLYYLDEQVVATGWNLAQAHAINNRGQIVGDGIAPDGNRRGFLFELAGPLGPPPLAQDIFVDSVRNSLGAITDTTDTNLRRLYDYVINDPGYDLADSVSLAQASYMLGTAFHEAGSPLEPIHEIGPPGYFRQYDNRPEYGNDQEGDGFRYRGRGYVQLTWKTNYENMGRIFGVDLVNNPDLALDHDLAYQILSYGMRNGSFTGAPMDWYINEAGINYVAARAVVNGRGDKADKIAGHALMFQLAFESALPYIATAGGGPSGPPGGDISPNVFQLASSSAAAANLGASATLDNLLNGGTLNINGVTIDGWEVFGNETRNVAIDYSQIQVTASFTGDNQLELEFDFAEELVAQGSLADLETGELINFRLEYQLTLAPQWEAAIAFAQSLDDLAIINLDPNSPGGLVMALPRLLDELGGFALSPNQATFMDNHPDYAGQILSWSGVFDPTSQLTVQTLISLFGDEAGHSVQLSSLTQSFSLANAQAIPEPASLVSLALVASLLLTPRILRRSTSFASREKR